MNLEGQLVDKSGSHKGFPAFRKNADAEIGEIDPWHDVGPECALKGIGIT